MIHFFSCMGSKTAGILHANGIDHGDNLLPSCWNFSWFHRLVFDDAAREKILLEAQMESSLKLAAAEEKNVPEKTPSSNMNLL